MVEPTTVLVIKVGGDDPLNSLYGVLARHVPLASDGPIDIDDARKVMEGHAEIGVVVIISPDDAIPGLVEDIRRLRADIHIVAVSIERGAARLSLQDSTLDGLTRIVRSLVLPMAEDEERPRHGQVVRLRTRLPSNLDASQDRSLPAVVPEPYAPDAGAALEEACAWVESATRNLLAIWSGDDEKSPAFAITGERLKRWLAALERIADPPAAKVSRAFDDLHEKLRHGAYARTPLGRLVQLVDGEEVAVKLLLIVVAADLDMRFHRLFGALHDDLGRRWPSVALVCAIIAAATDKATSITVRAQIAALARLRELGLIQGLGPGTAAADDPLRLEPRYVDWLLSGAHEHLVEAHDAGVRRAAPETAAGLLSETRRRQLRRIQRRTEVGHGQRGVAAIMLSGSHPGWLGAEASVLATPEIRVRPSAEDPGAEALNAAVRALAVASRLTDRTLVVDLRDGGPCADALWRALGAQLPAFPRPPLVIAPHAADLLTRFPAAGAASAHLPEPSLDDRRDAVAALLAEHGTYDADLIEMLADRFLVPLELLSEAAGLALSAAAAAGRPLRLAPEDWLAGFRRAAGSRAPRFARRVEPRPRAFEGEEEEASSLDPIFLPPQQKEQLRSLIAHTRFGRVVLEQWGLADLVDGRGVAALFAGESGTGKTMAAHAVASELGADLYVVDLAQVVSKYIGETEKNLDLIFEDAQRAGAVLLFDEADALFGKRSAVSDAHDRYANIEVAFLLQRVQQFAGLAILTSNHPENIDPAFTRRLRFRVEFPRPAPTDRLRIWEQSLPRDRRAEDLDLGRLAFALDVTGGVIRLMAVDAAVRAAQAGRLIGWDDVAAGARSQLLRLSAYDDLAKLEAVARARADAAEAA